MADPWEAARQREIQRINDRMERLPLDLGIPFRDMLAEMGKLERELDWIRRNDRWLPAGPPRKVPTLWVIASHWATREVFRFDLELPCCFGCGYVADCKDDPAPKVQWNSAAGQLERAHLVDRCAGGLDGPQNVVPLCSPCHRVMPVFDIGEGPDAIEWVKAGGRLPLYQSIATQVFGN